ncbi:MAG: vWA domain-containing protein [Planctomycetota bacterium]|nr:vWA domain-containing protein [Planctomycetota bacterium]
MMGNKNRKGAGAIMVLVMTVVMLIFSAFCIGICQIQLANSETQMVADCCSISATAILGEEISDNFDTPEKLAHHVAEQNSIFGATASLKNSNISIGSASMNPRTGKMDFKPDGFPKNAVRVDVVLGKKAAMSKQKLLFPFMSNMDSFAVSNSATTAKLEHDICLVFDRSQSMCHHKISGRSRPKHPDHPFKGHYRYFPHPRQSRWSAVVNAVIPLKSALEKTPMKERLGIVTFACKRNFTFEGRTIRVKAATEDISLTNNYNRCHDRLKSMHQTIPMVNGQTWIHDGIDRGAETLFGKGSRPHAFKTMIVLSDGAQFVRNQPGSTAHYAAARRVAAQGIRIHAVAFGADKHFPQMKK